jgi:hypothetical protein
MATKPVKVSEPKSGNPKKRNILSGAVFHNFNEKPLFCGTFMDECKNEEGETIGYNFVDENGEIWVLGKNYAIERALNTVLPGEEVPVSELQKILEITFLGKVPRKAGGEFNRFKIDIRL